MYLRVLCNYDYFTYQVCLKEYRSTGGGSVIFYFQQYVQLRAKQTARLRPYDVK